MEDNTLNLVIDTSLICVFCEEHFSSKEEIMLHMQCHNIERPYICTDCDKRYAYKNALKRHKAIHTKETLFSDSENGHQSQYECKNCGLKFRFANALVQHANRIHNNKKPFACSICNSCFLKKYHLDRHVKIHRAKDIIMIENNRRFSEDKAYTNDQQGDLSNNIAEIINETINNDTNEELNENIKKRCVSCDKKLKLKKVWGKCIFNERLSFQLNDYLSELALKRWEVSWENVHARICVTCIINLVSGNEKPLNSNLKMKKRGRPKVKQSGFVTVCSSCHTEVKRTYKKHICSKSSIQRNVKEIIDKSDHNNNIFSNLQSFQNHPPKFIANADDLILNQSVSRLSSRQMHKQTKLWKGLLKDQGFDVHIAGQKTIDKVRKERVDDLFEVTEVQGNVGPEKNPIYINISVEYCNNICELARRIAKHRNTVLSMCKLQGDHGQGSLKLSMQFDVSNSVSNIIILAVTEESKDSILTIKELETLVNPQSLQENLGVTILRTGDLQYLQLSVGIKTGNATYPCPFCYWRMTGENRDAADAECVKRNVQNDIETFSRLGCDRKFSHRCHGQQQSEPAFKGVPSEVFVPPCLHINLGLVNHVLEKMELKHGE